MRWIETAHVSLLNCWPRAPLKRDRGSHAVAQRHSLGCYLPAPAMATPSISIPSTPAKMEGAQAAAGANGLQPLALLFRRIE
jgi:hypothetical protein